MGEKQFKIIYGKFAGIEKRTVEMLVGGVADYMDYPVPVYGADLSHKKDLADYNLIIVGTVKSNCILKDLADKRIFTSPQEEQGYSIKISDSVYNQKLKMIIICGYDDAGALYGAADFIAGVIPSLDTADPERRYPGNVFTTELLRDYEIAEAPSVKERGIWSWGHVIYDYEKYIENMARLKLNTLILWNDFVPVNISDVIDEAHSWGIKIYLGVSWGWNEARPENGGLDISDENKLLEIQKSVIKNYEDNYADLNIDGIYFQSFTETDEEEKNGVVIAERVVKFVNDTAEQLLKKAPQLSLIFGLHASSVCDKLEYIKNTDERIRIMWEDMGAFPFSYTPRQLDNYDAVCDLAEKAATLRNKAEHTGIVSKGLTCLDWLSFSHAEGEFVMGKYSLSFIESRAKEKEKLWKYVDSYWIKNAKYAYDMFKRIYKANKNVMITALIEDGMLEAEIHISAALFAQMLWNLNEDINDLKFRAFLRDDLKG